MNAVTENINMDEFYSCSGEAMCLQLHNIIQESQLTAVFQPILDMSYAKVIGFEGLVRGPADSMLHSPMELFRVARECNMAADVEYLTRRIVLESFAKLGLPGKIFLNISPDILLHKDSKAGETLRYIEELGMQPNQVIIELTENSQMLDYQLLRDATQHYRNMGFEIAIDDLGEGFSGLRLWSEIRPDYVKIDKHFIHRINSDPVKLQFARSIHEIAAKSGARVIAEGIETHDELMAIRDLGIAFGQGFHIAKPNSTPILEASPEIIKSLMRIDIKQDNLLKNHAIVEKLLKPSPSVDPTCCNEDVCKMFDNYADLYSIPVVLNGCPVGLISRSNIIGDSAYPHHRELYGHRPCEMIMDKLALIVDKKSSIHDLNALILQSKPHHLANGFIITDNGQYSGMGSGHDLLRLITQM